jgi:DNA-binding beta-propeller fold protein YncE
VVGATAAMRTANVLRLMVAALVAVTVVLSGCASTKDTPRGELRYGMESSAEGKLIHFPPPPEQPRYAYAGELIGERNFFYEKARKGFWERVLDVLTGVGGGTDELELLRPQAVATDADGRVFVTDLGRAAVFVFDPVDGQARVLSRAHGTRRFIAPTGITIGPNGEIFVADSEAGLVARLNSAGETKEPIGAGVLQRPTGLAFDAQQQRLLVADTSAHNIKVFDLEGRLLETLGEGGDRLGEFNRPTHLAIWRNELYVADTLNARVQVLDLDTGQPIRSVGTRGTYVGQMVRPKGVALDSEGNLYVVESYHDHLLVFDRAGRFLLPIGGTGHNSGKFYLPAGLWIDGGNRIYLADMFNGRVVTYLFLGGEAESED